MTLTELQTLFPSPEWPVFLSLESGDNRYSFGLLINSDIRWFEGHFPEQPVLAGVVQTHWAAQLACALFPLDEFQGVDNLKFQTVILPGQTVHLTLDYLAEKSAIKFTYQSVADPAAEPSLCSEGKLLFGEGFAAQETRTL